MSYTNIASAEGGAMNVVTHTDLQNGQDLTPQSIHEAQQNARKTLNLMTLHADQIGEQVYGVPDLAVEVLLSGTWRLDRHEKFSEYAQARVGEYWIVDPERQTIEVFMLRAGAYELLGKWGRGEVVRSVLLAGFEVAVDEVIGE